MDSNERLIEDRKVAAFLMNREKSRHLDPFLAQDCTLKMAALQLGLSKSRMSYWVVRLLKLGLIAVVHIERQKRHNVRVYRSVADSFALPIDLLPATDVEILEYCFNPTWHEFLRSLAQAGRKNASGWHLRLLRRDALPSFQILPATADLEEARIFNTWARLSLTDEEVTELRNDLQTLLERYLKSPDAEVKTHLLHLAVVETLPE